MKLLFLALASVQALDTVGAWTISAYSDPQTGVANHFELQAGSESEAGFVETCIRPSQGGHWGVAILFWPKGDRRTPRVFGEPVEATLKIDSRPARQVSARYSQDGRIVVAPKEMLEAIVDIGEGHWLRIRAEGLEGRLNVDGFVAAANRFLAACGTLDP